MSEEDKINNLTEKDIKGLNGFIDFLDMLNDSSSLQKYKTTSQYTATEISQLTTESYYQGRADEAEKWKERVDYLETLIDALQTYYSITVEDLENCIKNDK